LAGDLDLETPGHEPLALSGHNRRETHALA
jgi:hypothetical protein